MTSEDVLKILRGTWLPEKYQILVHGRTLTLDEIIQRITTWERMAMKNTNCSYDSRDLRGIKSQRNSVENRTYASNYRSTPEEKKEYSTKEVRCYGCNQLGHYKINCPKRNKKINNIQQSNRTHGVDNRLILLDGKEVYATFDTGATESFISMALVKKLGADIQKGAKEKLFKLANGSDLKIGKHINCKIRYNEEEQDEQFNVIDDTKK